MTVIWESPDAGNITELVLDEATGSLMAVTDAGGVYVLDVEKIL